MRVRPSLGTPAAPEEEEEGAAGAAAVEEEELLVLPAVGALFRLLGAAWGAEATGFLLAAGALLPFAARTVPFCSNASAISFTLPAFSSPRALQAKVRGLEPARANNADTPCNEACLTSGAASVARAAMSRPHCLAFLLQMAEGIDGKRCSASTPHMAFRAVGTLCFSIPLISLQ